MDGNITVLLSFRSVQLLQVFGCMDVIIMQESLGQRSVWDLSEASDERNRVVVFYHHLEPPLSVFYTFACPHTGCISNLNHLSCETSSASDAHHR